MKTLKSKFLLTVFCLSFLVPILATSQNKRHTKPNRYSKIESADTFVNITYQLYNKVYVHDSLTHVGVEIPIELTEELLERSKSDVDSLVEIIPDVIDDIANSNASMLKKARATLNLNKSKKALKYCVFYMKQMVVGTKEDDE